MPLYRGLSHCIGRFWKLAFDAGLKSVSFLRAVNFRQKVLIGILACDYAIFGPSC
jgi:hypothetical protein